ncbi:MAG: hypothetical protein KAX37_11000, partial [Opitutaceae bacterium]|nr:hypothetical protein [Opitutaceae bacterium]
RESSEICNQNAPISLQPSEVFLSIGGHAPMLGCKIADRSACLCRVDGHGDQPDEIANERSQCLAGYGSFPH